MTLDQEEILVVGYDFKAGAEANTDIDSLLGYQTVSFYERSIRCDSGGCYDSPDYCNDSEITLQKLKELNISPLISPAMPYSKQKTHKRSNDMNHQYVAFFAIGGEQHVTRPCESEAEALSCVLWYVLAYFY